MIDLAVATQEETFERMGDPLAERGIAARGIQTKERTLDVAGSGEFAGFDAGFVYPPRIMEGAVVDARLGVPWINDREDVLASRNKAGALATLDAAGLSIPETVVVSNPTDEVDYRDAFERFDPPVVVKPNSATRGIGVTKATDLDSFLGICDYLELVHDYRATGDKAFLVQEYLPDARDFRVMTIEGEYVGAVERRLPGTGTVSDPTESPDPAAQPTGAWKHNVHRGAEATGVDLDPDLRDLAERAAEALGVDWLGVDLLVSGDRAVVNETNARPTIDAATKYQPDFYDRLAALIEGTASDT
ncbi:MAG: RimK family alpha-L-glutamate ligase [Halobacteriales archaeon]